MIDLDREREMCKLVLKLDFTAHGIMEFLSELGLIVQIQKDLRFEA